MDTIKEQEIVDNIKLINSQIVTLRQNAKEENIFCKEMIKISQKFRDIIILYEFIVSEDLKINFKTNI